MNLGQVRDWTRRRARDLLDIALPPRCLGCGVDVDAAGRLCPACWAGVRFLAPPFCACCGLPFPYDAGPGALCGGCSRHHPPYERARSVFAYDAGSRDLVLGFKHRDRTDAAPAFAAWMARAGAEVIADADLLVPVPLHWTRLAMRRFNQAALLANALGRATGRPVLVDALGRRRRTPSQGRMGRAERQENVRGAFRVHPRRRAALAGRRVLLIDDVMTTGATLEAGARALLGAGAAAVDALTLARVGGDAT